MDVELVECQCTQCGISMYIEFKGLHLEFSPAIDMTVIKNMFCSECGGELILIGRAGEEPCYPTDLRSE